MERAERHSILCPNCRKLISVDEPSCPYCGLANPGSRWKNNFWTRGFLDSDEFIKIIIYTNAVMFILSILMSASGIGLSMNPLNFLSPNTRSLLLLGATGTIPIDRFHRWWTLLSANYLHGSILHILFNMIAFKQIAPLIFQEFGGYRTFVIYTLSGVGGYIVSYLGGTGLSIGASAAIMGLIGAGIYYGKSRGGEFGQMIYSQVGGWAIGIFVFGFFFPGIDNWAHGGGLVTGAATAFLLGYRERRAENFLHKALAGICAAATLGALVWAVGTAMLISLS